MNNRGLLIFDLDGARFGLDVSSVRETVWLPELTPIEEAPSWVVGIFGLRGEIIAVTDLRRRLGHPAREYRLSDQVVVLKTGCSALGLIVGEVLDVVDIAEESILPPPEFDPPSQGFAHLINGVAYVGDHLVALVDVVKLASPLEPATGGGAAKLSHGGDFLAAATAEVRARFHARAQELRRTGAEERDPGLGLAVVTLAGEYFGIELTSVQEFCPVGQITLIPCCPPHILGVMNLRGNLLTLIDPGSALNLRPVAEGNKAVIARIPSGSGLGRGEQWMGMVVDDVHDVVYIRNSQLHAPPAALLEQCGTEITAIAPYAGKTLTLLDLPALLSREAWVVDETV